MKCKEIMHKIHKQTQGNIATQLIISKYYISFDAVYILRYVYYTVLITFCIYTFISYNLHIIITIRKDKRGK